MRQAAANTGNARHAGVLSVGGHCASPSVLLQDSWAVLSPARRGTGDGIQSRVCRNMFVRNALRFLLLLLGNLGTVLLGMLAAPPDAREDRHVDGFDSGTEGRGSTGR